MKKFLTLIALVPCLIYSVQDVPKFCQKNIKNIDEIMKTLDAEYDFYILLMLQGSKNAYEDIYFYTTSEYAYD